MKYLLWSVNFNGKMSSPNITRRRVEPQPGPSRPNQNDLNLGSSLRPPQPTTASPVIAPAQETQPESENEVSNATTALDAEVEGDRQRPSNLEGNEPPNRAVRTRRRSNSHRIPRIVVDADANPPNQPVETQQPLVQPTPVPQPQPIEQGQGEQQNNAQVLPQPPAVVPPVPPPLPNPPAQEDPFNQELRVIKEVVDYLVVPLARSSIYLMILGWYLLYFPYISLALNHNILSNVVIDVIVFSVFGGLAGKAFHDVINRPDIRISAPFHAFETRVAQLMTVSTFCILLDTVMNPIGYGFGILFFNTQNSKIFKSQVEYLRKQGALDYIKDPSLWFHVNLHFLIIGYATLFAVDIACTFRRMTLRNAAMQEIFAYEFYAYLYPVGYIVSTLFLMNCVATFVPVQYQSIWYLWLPLVLFSLAWIGLVFAGVFWYPDIPLRRPMGLPGYMYMEQVTLAQIGIGGSLHGLILLMRGIYFQLVPGTRVEAFLGPGVLTGAQVYFSQLYEEKRKVEGDDVAHPFPFSYELIHGIYFMVFLIRYVKLRMAFEGMQDRVEMAIRAIRGEAEA